MNTWEEQEHYWNVHLERLADEVGLSADKIWSARQQLKVVFGEEWLKQSYEKIKKFHPGDDKGITELISNPIVNNAVEAVELAKYLREFSSQKNFQSDIVTKLKSADDFSAIRLNIAFAYRLKMAGWQDVYLEPPLGDIEGRVGGVNYVVECSMIKLPPDASNMANEIFNIAKKIIDAGNKPTWVDIDFKKSPLAADLSRIAKECRRAYYGYLRSGETYESENDLLLLSVREPSRADLDGLEKHMAEEKWDFGYKVVMRTPRSHGDIYSVDLDSVPDQEHGILTIKGLNMPEEEKSTLDRLKEKLKQKKKQTESVPDSKRRMFIFMSNAKVEREDWGVLSRELGKGVKATDNIDAIIFVDRRHQEYGGKLRYPSGQVHFFTSQVRLPHLEKSVAAMKRFEESDWL